VPDSRIPALLEDDPMLLVTPLVRSGNVLAVGWNEAQWRDLVKQAG
jgi:arsenate reductase-like glutaredoxin family protein